MKPDSILEEVWRIKDKLSREMAADPDAYFAKLDAITKAEEKAGRKALRSPSRHHAESVEENAGGLTFVPPAGRGRGHLGELSLPFLAVSRDF